MMEQMHRVKKCSNPECPKPSHVYVNGKTHCDACGSELMMSDVEVCKTSLDLLESLAAARAQMKTLMLKKSRTARG